ncbi:MAG: hypothetical protein CSB13_09820 [Chloroflexi bacterium]|nr:MAG: hypothetical protein CSB13_09820 [Chloroflexota bacterium]
MSGVQRRLVLSRVEADAETQRTTSDRWSWVIGLLIVMGIAAFLRFYRLHELPPGMWFDEAWSAVAARETAAQGVFPPYFAASFGGMHPAIVYLTRFANLFTGGHPLTIRYALAVVGTLTVGLAFFCYRAIFGLKREALRLTIEADRQSSILALLAAFILAITFPFLLFTRIGFESSLVAPASLLVFWCLAVALRKGKAGWYGLTGAVLGLSLYSFDTARFLPFAVSLAYWGVVLLHQREAGWRRHLLNFAWLTLAALVVFAPLGRYFFLNWEQFTERAGITTYHTLGPGAKSVPLALLRNVWRTVGGLSLPRFGDVIARHNLPGRPLFDLFLSILFWLGVGVLGWRWKRPFSIILISWAGVMLLPVILTDGAPTYTRIFGAIPALAAMAALPYSVCRKPCFENRSRLTADSLRLTVLALLLLSLATTAYDYFERWADEPALYDQFQVGEWQAAMLAKERLATDTVYLVPAQVAPEVPTFDLVLGGSNIREFGANCLAGQAEGKRPLTYILKPSSAPDTLAALQAVYPQGAMAESIISPLTGEELFSVFHVPIHNQRPADNEQRATANAQFGENIQLLGRPEMVVTETAVTLPFTWQARGHLSADHTYFVHLYQAGAEDEPPLAQLDQQPCLVTSRWHEGEIVRETAVLPIPAHLPPGEYTLGLGWYTWPTFERLPLTNSTDSWSGNRLPLGQITIGDTEATP